MKGVRLSILGSLSSANQFCRLIKTRMEYVPAYVNHLEHGKVGGDEIIREMDKNLEETTILVFRYCFCNLVSSTAEWVSSMELNVS